MRRPLATALLTVTALLALTGCLKLDADIEVHEDETISGTMTLGMSKDAVEMLDSMAEGFGETSEEGGLTASASRSRPRSPSTTWTRSSSTRRRSPRARRWSLTRMTSSSARR